MNILRDGMVAAICVALGACAGVVTTPAREGCYAVAALNASQQRALHVGQGNPILLAGGEQIVCTCYRDSSLAGRGESGRLAGAGEGEKLAGGDESGKLVGAGEGGKLAGGDESGKLVGAGEGGRLGGAFAKLSCRIIPGCPGFQLTGYEPDQITVLTAAGSKSVPTRCVTW